MFFDRVVATTLMMICMEQIVLLASSMLVTPQTVIPLRMVITSTTHLILMKQYRTVSRRHPLLRMLMMWPKCHQKGSIQEGSKCIDSCISITYEGLSQRVHLHFVFFLLTLCFKIRVRTFSPLSNLILSLFGSFHLVTFEVVSMIFSYFILYPLSR